MGHTGGGVYEPYWSQTPGGSRDFRGAVTSSMFSTGSMSGRTTLTRILWLCVEILRRGQIKRINGSQSARVVESGKAARSSFIETFSFAGQH